MTTLTNITGVFVRDTDAKQSTTIKAVNGGTLYLNQLPKNWTLSFIFSTSFRQVAFAIDGHTVHIEQGSPFCVNGDNAPINLPVGSHTITVTVDQQLPMFFTVNVAQQPSTTIFGTNFVGASDQNGSPVKHPVLADTAKKFGFKLARFWQQGSLGNLAPLATSPEWSVMPQWANAGVDCIYVINFQNSPVRCHAPTDTQWTNYLNSLPGPSITGAKYCEIGNELDFSAYFTDAKQGNNEYPNYLNLLKIAYPILNKKGYKVIAANCLFNLNPYKYLAANNGLQYVDAIGRHAYEGTATGCLAGYDEIIAFGAANGKQVICTEVGLHGSSSNLPAWGAQQQALFTGLRTRAGSFLHFCCYNIAGDSQDLGYLLTAPPAYQLNQPFYSQTLQGMTGVAA